MLETLGREDASNDRRQAATHEQGSWVAAERRQCKPSWQDSNAAQRASQPNLPSTHRCAAEPLLLSPNALLQTRVFCQFDGPSGGTEVLREVRRCVNAPCIAA